MERELTRLGGEMISSILFLALANNNRSSLARKKMTIVSIPSHAAYDVDDDIHVLD